MLNNFTGAVRATRDAEVKVFAETKVTTLGLCTSSNQKVRGEWIENTLFFKGIMFGHAGERLAGVKKGDLLLVSGQLVNRTYKDREGSEHQDLNLEIHRFEPIAYPKKDADAAKADDGSSDLPF